MTAVLEGKLADRDAWTADRCSIAKALDVLGTRSSFLLMREAFYGGRRFDDLARRAGITEASAAARLKELTEHGLLERRPYQEPGQRTRHEYVLTEKGRDLLPVALALMAWGDKHLTGSRGAPLALRHRTCGSGVAVEVRCAEGHPVPLEELGVRVAQPRR
ncbi:MAG: transcriptional regulator [Frankiales bacterium]|nr:transcriptional regulator [Frankiales bacterium]